MPIITLEQTGDADVERGGAFSLFTRTADVELRERGLFIGESLKVIERAMVAGAVPRAMLLPEKLLEDTMPVIKRALAADASTPIYVAPKALFKEITGYEVVRSALAVFERPSLPNATELLDSLGARRVAGARGYRELDQHRGDLPLRRRARRRCGPRDPSCHDPLFRRAARVSMGTVFQVPWTRIGNVQSWAGKGIPLLHDLGFKVAAMALSDESISLDDEALRSCEKLAIVLGTEGEGLSQATIDASDYTVKIPMAHDVDSLNVAAASAVAFWELRVR